MDEEKQTKVCPKCGANNSFSDSECQQCGIIFSKYEKRLAENITKKIPDHGKWKNKFIFLAILTVLFAFILEDVTKENKNKTMDKEKIEAMEKVLKILETTWTTSTQKNEMTGRVTMYAESPLISPIKIMDSPYSDVKGRIYVGCSDDFYFANIWFTTAPNLNDTKNHNGFHTVYVPVRWEDQIETYKMDQTWGDKDLSVREEKYRFINRLSLEKEAMIELHWYGQGYVHFKFPLNGAADAIEKIRATCSPGSP